MAKPSPGRGRFAERSDPRFVLPPAIAAPSHPCFFQALVREKAEPGKGRGCSKERGSSELGEQAVQGPTAPTAAGVFPRIRALSRTSYRAGVHQLADGLVVGCSGRGQRTGRMVPRASSPAQACVLESGAHLKPLGAVGQ